MNNLERYTLARFTRPERTTSSVAGEFLFALGLGLFALVVLLVIV